MPPSGAVTVSGSSPDLLLLRRVGVRGSGSATTPENLRLLRDGVSGISSLSRSSFLEDFAGVPVGDLEDLAGVTIGVLEDLAGVDFGTDVLFSTGVLDEDDRVDLLGVASGSSSPDVDSGL